MVRSFLAFGLAFLLLPSLGLSEESLAKMTLSGRGEVTAAPDMARVSLGVVAQARSAKSAMDQVSKQMRDVMARLEGAGIEARDLQTSDLNLRPQYARDNSNGFDGRRVVGYQASNTLGVRVRDLDMLGQVLDQALSDGVNQLFGLQFSVSDPAPLLEEARRQAVAEARAKALLYAEAAGVELGRLLTLSEANGQVRPQVMMMEARMAVDAVPVAAGEVGLSADVTLVYEILQ